jgi:hypothetical protein
MLEVVARIAFVAATSEVVKQRIEEDARLFFADS